MSYEAGQTPEADARKAEWLTELRNLLLRLIAILGRPKLLRLNRNVQVIKN